MILQVELCYRSFYTSRKNLKAAAQTIYDDVVDASSDAKFAVAGFRDYPYYSYGSSGDPGNPGDPGNELDILADETGGSVQEVSSDGANIAAAILKGLGNLPITVTPVPVGCDPLVIGFTPTSQTVISGDPAIFTETITVLNDPTLEGTTQICTVEFRDENENILGTQRIKITIPDTTPPVVGCMETGTLGVLIRFRREKICLIECSFCGILYLVG